MRLARIVSNSFALVLLDVLNKAMPLIVFPVVVRVLGPAVYGKLGFAGAVAGFFALLASPGFTTYAVREAARDHAKLPFLVQNVVGARLCFALGSFLLLAVYTLYLAPRDGTTRLLIVLSGLAFGAGSLDIQWIFEARSRMWTIAARGVLSQLFYAGIILAFVRRAGEVWIIPLAAALSMALTTALLWVTARREYGVQAPKISVRTWPLFLPVCMVMGFASLMSMIYDQIDTVMLKYFRSDAEVGLYVASYGLMSAAVSFLPVLGQLFMPLFSETAGKGVEEEKKYLGWALYATVGLAVPIAAGGCILAMPLTQLVLGNQYAGSGLLFRWLMLNILTSPLASYYGARLITHGRERRYLMSVMAGAAINVVLNLVLIPRYGAVAAAITTAVSQVVVAMMNYYFSRDLWKPRLQGPLALSVCATCLMMAGLMIVRGDLPVVIAVLFGALLYGGAYALGIGVWTRMGSRANLTSA